MSAPPRALVALGSNLAGPPAQLRRAAEEIADLGRVVARSSLWRTAPVGGPGGQPDYLNAVLALEPAPALRDPPALLRALLALEARHGRRRRRRWAARTLDLDLLALGDRVLALPELELPHPRMMARAFVLAPLCEVAPGWRHPRTGEGACEALARLDSGGVERTDLPWGAPPPG